MKRSINEFIRKFQTKTNCELDGDIYLIGGKLKQKLLISVPFDYIPVMVNDPFDFEQDEIFEHARYLNEPVVVWFKDSWEFTNQFEKWKLKKDLLEI